jgi:alkanesulfonate monooxygenase SsuD/methylene tetrahydromethanopterin reductase-like flavin-dependent oxidoreductase (luciferase family)
MTQLAIPPHHRADRLDPAPGLAAALRPRSSRLVLGLDLTSLGVSTTPWTPTADEPRAEIDQQRVAELVRLAELAELDFVAFDEDFALAPGLKRTNASRLDAARVACRLAPMTSTVGLVATIDTSYLDPLHVATAVATLDAKSGGRAAWQVGTSQARLIGDTDEVWERLGREIRTAVPGAGSRRRTADDVRSRPAVVIRASSPASLAVAGAYADVVRIEAPDAQAARALREGVRAAAGAAGRDPDDVRVLVDAVTLISPDAAAARARLDILGDLHVGEPPWRRTLCHLGNADQLADLVEAWFSDGVVDGFTMIPGSLPHDAGALAGHVLPVLQERGIVRAGDKPRDAVQAAGDRRPEEAQAAGAEQPGAC